MNAKHSIPALKPVALMVMALFSSNIALSAPTGGVVTTGNASINQSGAVTNINQSTPKASINWQGFSVAGNETVNFNQPSASSVTLNRVIGNEKSVIDGALNANGQVFLLNSNGVLFGKGSQVNVGGLVASTRNITDENFNAGNYVFEGDGKGGAVVNMGQIKAKDGGYVALLGGKASNQGVIVATRGTVALSAGEKVTLNFNGDSLLSVTIDQGTLDALVENKQAIYADGGTVILTAKAADELLSAQVNNSGIIQARTIADLSPAIADTSPVITDPSPVIASEAKQSTGKIELNAHGGTASVGGTLDASAPDGGDGGFIETSGDRVKVADGAVITTLAEEGKTGTWLIDPTDYTIGEGGDMSGTQLGASLETGNVEIKSVEGGKEGNGDIHVNDKVEWSADTALTLTAERDININNAITVKGKDAKLVMNYGGDYHIRTKASYAGTDIDPETGEVVPKQIPENVTYGSITFSNENNKDGLEINGQTYQLIHSMAELDGLDNVDARYTKGSLFSVFMDAYKTTHAYYEDYWDPARVYDPLTDQDVVQKNSDNKYYNPETMQHDLDTPYNEGKTWYWVYELSEKAYRPAIVEPQFKRIYWDFADKNPGYTIPEYDTESGKYWTPRYYMGEAKYEMAGAYDSDARVTESASYYYDNQKTGTYSTLPPPDDDYKTPTKFYALAKDLDAAGTVYARPLIGPSIFQPFQGTLAGLGNTINNLTIKAKTTRDDNVALVGVAGDGSVIRDVALNNATISVKGRSAAGLAAIVEEGGTVSNFVLTNSHITNDHFNKVGNQINILVDPTSGAVAHSKGDVDYVWIENVDIDGSGITVSAVVGVNHGTVGEHITVKNSSVRDNETISVGATTTNPVVGNNFGEVPDNGWLVDNTNVNGEIVNPPPSPPENENTDPVENNVTDTDNATRQTVSRVAGNQVAQAHAGRQKQDDDEVAVSTVAERIGNNLLISAQSGTGTVNTIDTEGNVLQAD